MPKYKVNNTKKSKIIAIRVEQSLYDFLKDVSNKFGIYNVSELIRKIIEYFFLAYYLEELKEPLISLRRKFLEKIQAEEAKKSCK